MTKMVTMVGHLIINPFIIKMWLFFFFVNLLSERLNFTDAFNVTV